MYHYDNDKDDPNSFASNQLFGQSFDEMTDFNTHNSFLNFETSHSLPTQRFDFQNDTSPSPSSAFGQDFLLSQFGTDYNNNNINFFDDNMFLDQTTGGDELQQQAILLSDPNFLRQQQLLLQEQQQQQQPMRSNLSAMFSNNSMATIKESKQKSPSSNSSSSSSSSNNNNKNTKPIPISQQKDSDIDHQRRFNELQARFRVNYAKKPQKQPLQDTTGTSMPVTLNEQQKGYLSSSYNNDSIMNNRRKSSLDTISSNSKPILRMNREAGKIKVSNTTNKSTSMAIPTTKNSSNNNSSASSASSFPSRTMPIQIQRVQRANAFQTFDLEQRQKRLDDQLVKVDFDDITVSELKELLRQRGKPATGKKALLLQRLQEERELIEHARANGIPISNRYNQQQQSPKMDHAASLPDTMYLSSSPNTTATATATAGLGSLNRSIADMHIGSPPMTTQQSRRFAPYATSPRTNSLYSSSVPVGNLDRIMMQQPEEDSVMKGFNFNKKCYAPFTSSALATPDREEDQNPFDRNNNQQQQQPMEWTDPSIEYLLQQQGLVQQQNNNLQDKSADELLSFLTSNQDLCNNNNFMYSDPLNGPDLSSIMFDNIIMEQDTSTKNQHSS